MSQSVLIVDDEATLGRNISRYLSKSGYETLTSHTAEDALRNLDRFKPDIILLDYQLPGMTGLEALRRFKQLDPKTKIILMTGQGDIKVAVEAMKCGASDYVSKPLVLAELKLLLEKTIDQQRMETELSYHRGKQARGGSLDRIIGESTAINQVRLTVQRYLDAEKKIVEGSPASVLITGETGTGKELVARAFHYDGTRAKQPFVEINCAAIPEQLIEAELFGFERGAFTDAKQRKAGLAESADGGTLFLDEIGDMDTGSQSKLLTMLESKKIRRVGGLRDIEVDVRVIAATNQDLDLLVREKKFRADLLYRLRVIHVSLPSLRVRGRDSVILAEYFLAEQGARYGKRDLRFAPEATQKIAEYSWPGNVRELRNVIEHAVLLTGDDVVGAGHILLPERHHQFPKETSTKDNAPVSLTDTEIELIQSALNSTEGNISSAAKVLGISRDTLRYRIKKYRLQGQLLS